jgi:hypothetical protein
MALPKNFTAGERLFASDLNDNFEHLEDFTEDAGTLLVPSTDDTGAPWSIPYIDGAAAGTLGALTEDMADAVADALDTRKFGQVVQTTKVNAFTTNSTTFATVTGMTASITPTSTSSRVLIIVQLSFSLGGGTFNDAYGHFKVTRAGTDIYRGEARSNRVRTVFGGQNRTDAANATIGGSIVYLDSPGTTSSTEYRVESRAATGNGAVYVNRGVSDSDADAAPSGASSITLIEVAA